MKAIKRAALIAALRVQLAYYEWRGIQSNLRRRLGQLRREKKPLGITVTSNVAPPSLSVHASVAEQKT